MMLLWESHLSISISLGLDFSEVTGYMSLTAPVLSPHGMRLDISVTFTVCRPADLQNGFDGVEADEVLLNKANGEKTTPAAPRRGSE